MRREGEDPQGGLSPRLKRLQDRIRQIFMESSYMEHMTHSMGQYEAQLAYAQLLDREAPEAYRREEVREAMSNMSIPCVQPPLPHGEVDLQEEEDDYDYSPVTDCSWNSMALTLHDAMYGKNRPLPYTDPYTEP